MSMVLTVEIKGDTHHELRQKLRSVETMIGEEFTGHDEDHPEDGSLRFRLTHNSLEEPTN